MAKEPLYPHVPKKKEPLFPHVTATQKAVQRLIEEVPDVDDPAKINYWKPLGDKWVYLEGWIDYCLSGTGFPSWEEGGWEDKTDYMRDLTPEILERKAKENNLELLEGGFAEKSWEKSPEHLYGVTWGVYGTTINAEAPLAQASGSGPPRRLKPSPRMS